MLLGHTDDTFGMTMFTGNPAIYILRMRAPTLSHFDTEPDKNLLALQKNCFWIFVPIVCNQPPISNPSSSCLLLIGWHWSCLWWGWGGILFTNVCNQPPISLACHWFGKKNWCTATWIGYCYVIESTHTSKYILQSKSHLPPHASNSDLIRQTMVMWSVKESAHMSKYIFLHLIGS